MRNVFITGGSRGVGRSIVAKFVREGWGCAFTYAGNEEAASETIELAREINPNCTVKSYKMNQKNAEEIEGVCDQVLEDFDTIDGVVNNAAILRNNAAAIMTDDEWEDVITTNLSGPFYIIRAFLMQMISNRFGRIINISSIGQDGVSGQVNYAAAKSGLIGMTKTLAREYGPKGITANVIALGLMDTDMSRSHMSKEMEELLLQYCPLKRGGTLEEAAGAVYFLATNNASYINGEVIRVAGGLTYVP